MPSVSWTAMLDYNSPDMTNARLQAMRSPINRLCFTQVDEEVSHIPGCCFARMVG
jgi:hypothetical protein